LRWIVGSAPFEVRLHTQTQYHRSTIVKHSVPTRAVAGIAAMTLTFLPATLLNADSSGRYPVSQSAADVDNAIVLQSAVTIDKVGSSGRTLLFADAVEAQRVTGNWKTPEAGDNVTLAPRPATGDKGGGETKDPRVRTWTETKAAPDGWLPLPGGAYASWVVHSDEDRVMVLEAVGHGSVCINNELHTGDPYEYGFAKVPVLLKKGDTELLFKGGRGRMRARLVPPPSRLFFNLADATVGDAVEGTNDPVVGAVIIINATTESVTGAVLAAELSPTRAWGTTLSTLPPLSTRKVEFRCLWEGEPPATGTKDLRVQLSLLGPWHTADQPPDDQGAVNIAYRLRGETHKRTFRSNIDGSIQYYSVVPPVDSDSRPLDPAGRALVLSLHGASVEATGQAAAYGHKDWCSIVCPTNRRSYGFDWEDWGRLDALEVLDIAQRDLGADRRRMYLTGHSMGGHGTWNLGVQFPDRFAAIAPSAGWISFLSYAGAAKFDTPTPVQQMLLRANAASDTLSMSRNFLQQGIYILHGDADDNVPVEQARTMRKHLAEYHADFAYYERPGAGHWWGNECVDWPPLFEFLKRHSLKEAKDVNHIEFITASPGVSATCHWVTISQQVHSSVPSRVVIDFDPATWRYKGTTENIASLGIRLPIVYDGKTEPPKSISVELDGQHIDNIPTPECKYEPEIFLSRSGDTWSFAYACHERDEPKNSHRAGPFKSAFQSRFMLVYGTHGTPEENQWAYAKARYDAEVFWYRGNGSVTMIPDSELESQYVIETGLNAQGQVVAVPPWVPRHANVILYGNQDTNAAWPVVLDTACPIQVRRDSLKVGDRELKQDNLSCLFVYPMKNDRNASVGVIAGTGLIGCRLTDRLPYFVSGVGLPDWTVLSTDMLSEPNSGLIGAGFFGNDWSIDHGDTAWK